MNLRACCGLLCARRPTDKIDVRPISMFEFYGGMGFTTSIFSHLRCAPPYPPFTLGVLLSGYSARYGYESGGLDHSMTFDELEERSHINDLAKPADQAADFSQRIRARLTIPQPPPSDETHRRSE